jgi:hypothetical protein
VHDSGTVVFFLYFPSEGEAQQASVELVARGCVTREIDPPDDPVDQTWALSAEQELHSDDVAAAVDRVRAVAGSCGGELDGVVTPWPAHPHGFPPARPPRG